MFEACDEGFQLHHSHSRKQRDCPSQKQHTSKKSKFSPAFWLSFTSVEVCRLSMSQSSRNAGKNTRKYPPYIPSSFTYGAALDSR